MRRVTMLSCLLLASGAVPACGGKTVLQEHEIDRGSLKQGVTGVVTKSVGDFQCCPSHGETYPISVPVHVIRGHVPYESGSEPELEDLELELSVHSAADGTFMARLAPGTYTVFAETGGGLYLNCNRTGDYCWVDVLPDEFVEFDIEDTSEATY